MDVNWTAVSAVGTLLAVLVALFGQVWRQWLVPPQLRLRLLDDGGESTTMHLTWIDDAGEQQFKSVPARFYHLRVTNERRSFPATQPQLILLRVEELGAGEKYHEIWT